MIILDATTKSLEIKLGEAHTTNALPIVTSYVDVTTTTYTPGVATNNSNGTSVVTIVSAPAASTQRQVKFISVYNADTVSHNVTIQYNNNSTTYVVIKVILAIGYTLIYTDGEGWRVLDTAGNLIQSANSSIHASTHKSGGSDPIKLDELAAPTDVTTLNATTSAHGLLKKLDNSATHYLDGQGNWTTPAGTGLTAATQAEMEAASSTTVGTTPGRQIYHPGACKAWVLFNGTGTPAITTSFNASSITDRGVGQFTVNWSVTFSSANHCDTGWASSDSTAATYCCVDGTGCTTTTTPVAVFNNSAATADRQYITVHCFGDL